MSIQGIEKFNLINESNIVKPNYDLSNKEVDIELYISKEKNYALWAE